MWNLRNHYSLYNFDDNSFSQLAAFVNKSLCQNIITNAAIIITKLLYFSVFFQQIFQGGESVMVYWTGEVNSSTDDSPSFVFGVDSLD